MASNKDAPSILGQRMKRTVASAGKPSELVWKGGPLCVEIEATSTPGYRPDFSVSVEVFGFVVATDWKPTEAAAAECAEKKLHRLANVFLKVSLPHGYWVAKK